VSAQELPLISFASRAQLREWLAANHRTSAGLRVRLFKKGVGAPSITFEDLLEVGLCYGWSESKRQAYDHESYVQIFTPRRRKGTASPRNRMLVEKLVASGEMTPYGLEALGLR